MAIKNAYLKNHNRLLAIAQNENITQKRRTGKEGAEQKLLGGARRVGQARAINVT